MAKTATKVKALPRKKVEVSKECLADLKKLPEGTKSSKIRALHAKGYERGQIALALNIRYQHVRNVLVTPIKRPVEK